MALAGFSIGEAEGLRRAMSRKRSLEALEAFRERFVEGAARNGVDAETANRVYDKLAAFSGFGFPEVARRRLRVARVPVGVAAPLLRGGVPLRAAQRPADGLLPPASLVRDAQRRGVTALPPDVNASEASCSVEDGAVRVGVGYVQGVGEAEAEAIAAARPYEDLRDLVQRAAVDRDVFQALVEAGACDCFGEPRRVLLWQLGLVPRQRPPVEARASSRCRWSRRPRRRCCPSRPCGKDARRLPRDGALGRRASVRAPASHLPPETVATVELPRLDNRSELTVAGMAIARQRPMTANGIVFMLLEDEHGLVNLVVPPQVYERHRALVRASRCSRPEGGWRRWDATSTSSCRSWRASARSRASWPASPRCARPSRGPPLRAPVRNSVRPCRRSPSSSTSPTSMPGTFGPLAQETIDAVSAQTTLELERAAAASRTSTA